MDSALNLEICARVSAMLKAGLTPRGMIYDQARKQYMPITETNGLLPSDMIFMTQAGPLPLYLYYSLA